MKRIDYRCEPESEVIAHARRLIGKSLQQLYGTDVTLPRGKGAFGQLVEQLHFGYPPNSVAELDFPVARLELKATGALHARRGWRAKERLVLSNINYEQLIHEAEFSVSSFFAKNARLLLLVYLWVADTSPMDYKVIGIGVVELDALEPAERQVIEDDWQKIRQMVLEGRAHEISEGDTVYLKAARKGAGTGLDDRSQPCSPIPAPNRAFSFPASFVTRLIAPLIGRSATAGDAQAAVGESELREQTFEEVLLARFDRFRGQSVGQIVQELDPGMNTSAKGFVADLARRMIGVKSRKIDEFEKAGIIMKIVRVQANGRPRESMSFPAFRYKQLITQDWFESDLRELLSRRFLFVFFDVRGDELLFSHAAFWAMPETVLDGEVRRVWQETVRRICSGRAHDLPKSDFSSVAHVRPHAKNRDDTDETPDGRLLTKHGFWLNADYIGKIYRQTAKAEKG